MMENGSIPVMNDRPTFGRNLKYLRESNKLSLQNCSDLLGLKNRSTYYSWERELAEPPFRFLIKLSLLFRVKIDDLIKKDLQSGHRIKNDGPLSIVKLRKEQNDLKRKMYDLIK